ncbi:MAG TPA: GldG family protein, partial [Rhodopila sp.]
MRRLLFSVLGVVAAAAIAIGVNMFADARLAAVQADLTQGKIYTLSAGTRQVLRDLKEPVTLRLFYSRQLGSTVPTYGSYADHVREMLRDYASLSKGKVKLEFYDPEPFSDTEDRAMADGLQGVPLDQNGSQIYFGLAGTNLEDDERTIPFFQADRERFLEYDLTKLVYELSNPKRPVVGVMSSLPLDGDPQAMMMGRQSQPYASATLLRQTNTVKTVATNAQVIDPDIQVLLVAEARDLSPATLYAIDQFVMRGGKLMVMVDPWSEALAAVPSPTGMPPTDTSSDLKKLFDAWGIVYDPTQVIGDLTGAWRVRAGGEDR